MQGPGICYILSLKERRQPLLAVLVFLYDSHIFCMFKVTKKYRMPEITLDWRVSV